MHNTHGNFKVNSFGLHPGHHQTYSLFTTYEKQVTIVHKLGKEISYLLIGAQWGCIT